MDKKAEADRLYLEAIFKSEIKDLCAQAPFARKQLTEGLGGGGPAQVWLGVHSTLIISANVSKLLWGGGRSEARKPLRKRVGVSRKSPLKPKRIRNGLEHVDQEIIKWAEKGNTHYAGRHIVREIDDYPPPGARFGTFNPDPWELRFLEEKPVLIGGLLDELEAISGRLDAFK